MLQERWQDGSKNLQRYNTKLQYTISYYTMLYYKGSKSGGGAFVGKSLLCCARAKEQLTSGPKAPRLPRNLGSCYSVVSFKLP